MESVAFATPLSKRGKLAMQLNIDGHSGNFCFCDLQLFLQAGFSLAASHTCRALAMQLSPAFSISYITTRMSAHASWKARIYNRRLDDDKGLRALVVCAPQSQDSWKTQSKAAVLQSLQPNSRMVVGCRAALLPEENGKGVTPLVPAKSPRLLHQPPVIAQPRRNASGRL